MPRAATLTKTKLLKFDPAMIERLKDFRFQNRINTESEALRQLLTIALDHVEKEAAAGRKIALPLAARGPSDADD
jgi:hypothetical protein